MSVEQTIYGWDGWPDDVRERLRTWNSLYLLSFPRGPDFLCEGCGRWIKSHPLGNAVLRPHRKAHGVLRCEDCVAAVARCYTTPPAALKGVIHGLAERYADRIRALEKRVGRLRMQLALDQLYIECLEDALEENAIAAIRNDLRGRYRREDG